ncbi:MAG: methyltransferase domain-containing protein [Clostridia bacterium]|nr:methyltransferase domain-containing protein [Clostridia bacterium]
MLESAEYDFLRTNQHLGRRIMLLGLSGSYGYGTNREDSDVDFRGVKLQRPSDILGLTAFEQYVDDGTDTVVYGFNKLVKLLLDCTTIEYAVVDIQHIPYADQSFDMIIANMMLYHVPDIPRALSEVRRVLRKGGTFCCATYGENGIMEYLAGLFQEYGVTGEANHTFTLQNGKKQLQAYFDAVERYDYEDSLEVTDVNDLADYILSLTGMSSLRALPRETIIKVLNAASVDGVLKVPKEYGLFLSH